MEVGAGAAFKCEMVGKACKSQYWSSVEPILLKRSIESALSLSVPTEFILAIVEFAGGEN
jgi:hypothetical protein